MSEQTVEDEEKSGHSQELVLYMLHCGLDGKILEEVCKRHGLHVRIHQFPREELFAYHMNVKRKAPDLILIRGHFIPLVSDLDHARHIPYVVISSKLKYGDGQPKFIHAQKGYGSSSGTLSLYVDIARALKEMVETRKKKESHFQSEADPACKTP